MSRPRAPRNSAPLILPMVLKPAALLLGLLRRFGSFPLLGRAGFRGELHVGF